MTKHSTVLFLTELAREMESGEMQSLASLFAPTYKSSHPCQLEGVCTSCEILVVSRQGIKDPSVLGLGLSLQVHSEPLEPH